MTNDGTLPLSRLDPRDTAVELRCIAAMPFLSYLKEKLGAKETERVVTATGMNMEYLQNPNNWISFDYYCRFLGKVVQIADDPDAPFRIARQYTDRSAWGNMAQFLVHLGSPASLFRLVVQFNALWNKVCEFRCIDGGGMAALSA